MTVLDESCALEILPGSPGEMSIQVLLCDTSLFGQQALLYIEAEAHVIDPVGPVHARRVLFTKEFELCGSLRPIQVSLRELGMCLYQGKTIEIRLYATLSIDGSPVVQESIDFDSLKLEALNPSFDPEAQESYEVLDDYTVGENYNALGGSAKGKLIVSAIILGLPC